MTDKENEFTTKKITPEHISEIRSRGDGKTLRLWFVVDDVDGNRYTCFDPYLLAAFAEEVEVEVVIEDTGKFETIREVVGFKGDPKIKPYKESEPKNPSEAELYKLMCASGWTVTRRGWPDFACFKDGKMILVEVKPYRGHHLKYWQHRLMQELAKKGVECYKWDPDAGFVAIQAPTKLPE